MRLRRQLPRLESACSTLALRRRAAAQWLPAVACSRARYSSTSAAYPERIAVLGGGIAGLSSAYFISKEFPNSKITVFEKQKKLGGWIKSNKVHVPGGDVTFESGPRTLRNSTPTAALIQELGLSDQLMYTKRSDPAAKNRYIYYPDQLNRLPSETPTLFELFSLWQSGLAAGAQNLITETFKPRRPSSMTDETVGSFLSRRIDKRVANNLVSAVFHGIYAGDIWKLSAKTLLSLAWQLEGRYGSILGGFFKMNVDDQRPQQLTLVHPYDWELAQTMNEEIDLDPAFAQQLKDASTFTFKNGLGQLVTALEDKLKNERGVVIKRGKGAHLSSDKFNNDGQPGRDPRPMISTTPHPTKGKAAHPDADDEYNDYVEYDLVINTLPSRDSRIAPAVTVMSINLFYANPTLLPVSGFGYLIPQSVPFEQNPERALGVIFDSAAAAGQDTAPGTKLTVMMGGHWWDGWEFYPTEEEGLAMAKAVLQRHLNITDEPIAHRVNLSHNCIPQFTIGYEERLQNEARLLSRTYNGKVRVVGTEYNGIGVNACITGAWKMAQDLRGDGWKSNSCGLDRVMDERAWIAVPASDMAYVKRGSGGA